MGVRTNLGWQLKAVVCWAEQWASASVLYSNEVMIGWGLGFHVVHVHTCKEKEIQVVLHIHTIHIFHSSVEHITLTTR